MTYIIQASIGRNIGSEPMSKRDWTRFLNDVADAIRAQGESPEVHFGTGTWEGVTEESARITVYRDRMPDPYALLTITDRLATLAGRYGQDAIGLVVSESILCTAPHNWEDGCATCGNHAEPSDRVGTICRNCTN